DEREQQGRADQAGDDRLHHVAARPHRLDDFCDWIHGCWLKADPVAHAEAGLRARLRTVLVEPVAAHVLPSKEVPAQASAPGARRKSSDLVREREVFAAHSEENVT